MNIMPYLCPWRKLDVVKIISAKIMCYGKAVEVLHR